jgi:hypothetical protein
MEKCRELKRNIFAESIPFVADRFGVSNEGFIASPFLHCGAEFGIGASRFGICGRLVFSYCTFNGYQIGLD